MDEKLQRLLGDAARAARLRLGLTQMEVAAKVDLEPGVYGRIERGHMMPSVPSLRRICTALEVSADALLSLGGQQGEESKAPLDPTPGEHPELSRIIHILQDWSPERLALLRKLLETADAHLTS